MYAVRLCEKKKLKKKIEICCDSRGYGPFCSGIFNHINILGFIFYSFVICNYSEIHHKGFHVNLVVFFVFLYFIIMSLISTFFFYNLVMKKSPFSHFSFQY